MYIQIYLALIYSPFSYSSRTLNHLWRIMMNNHQPRFSSNDLSKQITERVRLTYTTTVGQANDQSFRLDYELTKNLFLEGQTDRYGRSLLNFKYGLRFK